MTSAVDAPGGRSHSWDWQDEPGRPCKDKPVELFFPTEKGGDDEAEPPYPPPEPKALCSRCPVRADCLQWALETGQEFGIWGGTTGYERSLLQRPKLRVYCPGCGSDEVIPEHRNQFCVACGVSWPLI